MLGVEEIRRRLIGAGQLGDCIGLKRIHAGIDEAEIAVAEALGRIQSLGLETNHFETGGALAGQARGVDGANLGQPGLVQGDRPGPVLKASARQSGLQAGAGPCIEAEIGRQLRIDIDGLLADPGDQGVRRPGLGAREGRCGKRGDARKGSSLQ